jgi:hypothetical protein
MVGFRTIKDAIVRNSTRSYSLPTEYVGLLLVLWWLRSGNPAEDSFTVFGEHVQYQTI